MHLTWRAMLGEIPRLEPHLLPDGNAQLAQNTKLSTGGLTPVKAPAFVLALGKTGVKKTLYRYGRNLDSDVQHWFHWLTDVDVCPGPLANDTQERVFFTGDGVPKSTDSTMATAGTLLPSAAYRLGLPAPATKPSVLVSGPAAGDPVNIVVAYQFVNSWNEPGPISEVSDPIDYYAGQTLEVGLMDGAPAGDYNVPYKRVYVSQTDATGNTALRFWKEIAVGLATTTGTIDFNTLGESVESPSMIAPPDDMFGIMLHPNKFLVGFTAHAILRSEANRPSGWPAAYRDPIGDVVVGGAIMGQSVVICTKGRTFLATGQDPLNQAIVDLAGYQPCVAKRSIRAMPFGVLYASPDGLVLVASAGPLIVISSQHFTREQWQALKPESMHAVVHDNRYYVWYDTGTVKGGIIFEFAENGAIAQLTRTDQYVTAAYADPRRDELFVTLPADNQLYKWDAGVTALTQAWKSKELRLPRPQAIGAAKVIADTYPVTFKLWGDGALVDTVTVADGQPFTLSGDDRFRAIWWEISGAYAVTQVDLASSIFDLRHPA